VRELLGRSVLALGRTGPDGLSNLLGTCFSVGGNKYATAAHVVGISDSGLHAVFPSVTSINDYQDTTTNSISMMPLSLIAYDPVRDIAILEKKASTYLSVPSVNPFNLTAAKSQVGMPSYALSTSDDLKTGDLAINIGYPHASDGRLVLTADKYGRRSRTAQCCGHKG
jgi:hypothetical protein